MAADPESTTGLSEELEFDERVGRAARAGLYAPGDPDLLGLPEPTANVTGPGLAALNAAGGRAPRRAAATTGDADPRTRDNWRPTGPRNVPGRIRALASDPRDANVLYAGSASGGIFKTEDGGERWFPLWQDEPSLAFGAIAVAATSPAAVPGRRRVYAATGEIVFGGAPLAGHGIWVSDDAGRNWTNRSTAVPPAPNPPHRRGFDAIAVDPTDDDHCWAAGGDGIFRTADGGEHWQHLLPGVAFSDVAFSDGRVYLARAASVGGEAAVLRIDPPASGQAATEADVAAALAAAASVSVVIPPVAAHLPWPARVKLAIASSSPTVAYVRVTAEDDTHVGIFRTTNATAASAGAIAWTRIADHPDFVEERSGGWCLCIAVSPDNPDHVATGMVDLHVTTNASAAAVTWRRAIGWQLWDELRGYHADQHQIVFLPPALWVASDGGVARSLNWATGQQVSRDRPLPPGAIVFRHHDSGIACSQPYDLEQSPLVPGVHAAGFQDMGVHLTAGGPTWRMVLEGDGGFAVFDPDDPYRLLVTSQDGIEALQFPGHIDRHFPDEQPPGPVPSTRRLDDGFRPFDRPLFVADTARHPRRTGRMLYTRRNRLYGTRGATGERWQAEDVGTSFELVVTGNGGTADVEVVSTDGAVRLGLPIGRKIRRRIADPLTDRQRTDAVARVASRLPGPFRLAEGDELTLRVAGVERTARFGTADAADLGAATLAEVLRVIRAVLPPGAEALPRLWPTPRAVELITRGRGAGQRITIAGSALAARPDGLSRLGLNAGVYPGEDGRPASITLGFEGYDDDEQGISRHLAGLELTVSVNGGPARSVRFDTGGGFADPTRVTAGELESALRAALASDPVDVTAAAPSKAVLLEAEPGHTMTVTGTAADRLAIGPTSLASVVLTGPTTARQVRRLHRRNFASVDLTSPGPDPLRLVITSGAASATVDFAATDVADLRSVTVEDVHRLVQRALIATPGLLVRAELALIVDEPAQGEVRYSAARPDEAWLGGADGRVFRTVDDGRTWAEVGSPEMRLADGQVEAIALHPTDPSVAFVGLYRPAPGPADRPLLFRTADGAETWQPVGSTRDGGALTGVVAGGVPAVVHALELDPGDPEVVLAATQAGVFRSANSGGAWAPFSEGLPNCRVVDLAIVAETRTVRAALWGRGAWERRLGLEPPRDVRLLIRTGELDDGTSRPGRAAPRLFGDAPGPDPQDSPDIKVVRRRPGFLGAAVDGVQFDLDLPADDVVPGGAAEILVQVHNRGAFAAPSTAAPPPPPDPDRSVRLVVLWTPASDDLPPLPPDFWDRFKAGPVAAAEASWTRALDTRLATDLQAGTPAVLAAPVAWPDPLDAREVAVLALATATEDVLDGGPIDVAELVARERRAALRRFPVRRVADDRALLLRHVGGRRFMVGNRPAPATAMAARLQIVGGLGALTDKLLAGTLPPPGTYDLSGTEPGLVVTEEPTTVDVEFHNDQGEFADLTHAAPAEIAGFLNARLVQAGVAAVSYAIEVGVRLRGLGGALVRVTGGTAAPRLGLAVMPPAAAVPTLDARPRPVAPGPIGWYDLRGNLTLNLEVRAQAIHALAVTFPSQAFDNAASASPDRVALLVNRAIGAARLDGVLRCDVVRGLAIRGRDEAQVTLTGGAAGVLGLPGGKAGFRGADIAVPGGLDLSGRPRLTVEVENRVTVRFDRDPDRIPVLAAAAPADVRRALNEAFEVAEMAVRAEVPLVALSVRASASEGMVGSRTGGGHLAELVTSGTVAVPVAARAGLFDVRTALVTDRLKAGVANQLYVRVRNDGNADATPARVRLFRLDPTSTPVTLTLSPPERTLDVAASSSAILNATRTPLAAAGAFEHLLVAVDQDLDGRRLDVPATFPDQLALVAFCESRPGAALRTLEVEA